MKTNLLALTTVALAASFAMADDQLPAGAAEKIAAAIPSAAYAKPLKPRKLLIFSVTRGFHHASIITGKLAFSEMGRKTGAYEAVVSDDLSNFEPDRIKSFDAICFLSTTGEVFSPSGAEFAAMDDTQKKAATEKQDRLSKSLLDYVTNGGGFIGIHAATDTLYKCPQYATMVNGWFNGHPWHADTPVSIKVEPGKETHPLAAMFGGRNLEFKEEIYQLKDPYDSKKVDMLLRLDTAKTRMNLPGIKRTDKDFGVAWVRHWGKGRMFYCSIGHNHDMYWNPLMLRHYLAGIQWALGDYQVQVAK